MWIDAPSAAAAAPEPAELWWVFTAVACIAGTYAMYLYKQAQQPPVHEVRWSHDRSAALPPPGSAAPGDPRWRRRAWRELGAEPPAGGGDSPGAGGSLTPEGLLLAAAAAGRCDNSERALLLAAAPGGGRDDAEALRAALRRRRAPGLPSAPPPVEIGAARDAAEAAEKHGRFDLALLSPLSCDTGGANWQREVDRLVLDAPLYLAPGGEALMAVTSMVEVRRVLREIERNGFVGEVAEERLFRWRERYYRCRDFVVRANQLGWSYTHTRQHHRVEKVTVLRWRAPGAARSSPRR